MTFVKLRATSRDESVSEETSAEFSTEELDRLRHYQECIESVCETGLVKKGLPGLRKIKWTAEAGLKFEFTHFERKDVYELLHRARPILLSKEPASFEKTSGLIGKKFKGAAIRKHLRSLRSLYDAGEYSPYFQISVNDVPLFSGRTLKNWLNGVEYHHDLDKRAQVKELDQVLSEENMRGIFAAQLSGKIKAAFLLAHIVSLILEKPDT